MVATAPDLEDAADAEERRFFFRSGKRGDLWHEQVADRADRNREPWKLGQSFRLMPKDSEASAGFVSREQAETAVIQLSPMSEVRAAKQRGARASRLHGQASGHTVGPPGYFEPFHQRPMQFAPIPLGLTNFHCAANRKGPEAI